MEADNDYGHVQKLLEQAVALGKSLGSQPPSQHTDCRWPPLHLVNAPTVGTEQAAYYMSRKGQTLREWACFDSGPLRPLRINGRLAWPVTRIRELLGVSQ